MMDLSVARVADSARINCSSLELLTVYRQLDKALVSGGHNHG